MNKTVFAIILMLGCQLPVTAGAEEAEHIKQGKQGIQAFSEGNLIQALDLLNKSAQQGYAPAQSTLAYILDKSDDDKMAFDWYRKAAEQGDADGQYGLSGMYAKGEGTEKNPDAAGRWLQKAAAQQHLLAMRNYATALENAELGLDRNVRQALDWYRKCSEAGDAVCTRRLARAYQRGELGLAADKKKSAELFNSLNNTKNSK